MSFDVNETTGGNTVGVTDSFTESRHDRVLVWDIQL